MIYRRRAFTLLEVIIGFSILAGVSLLYIVFVRSSSKELQFSADHLNAVVLSQKVSEDIIEELSVNPYGFETLGISGCSDELEVVDGKSVFFSFIEDSKAPFGIIDLNTDGSINPQMQPLYDTVKDYKFNVEGQRLSKSGDHEDRNLMQGEVDFNWKTQTGRGEFNTSVQLFSPVTRKKIDLGLAVDEDAIDARIPAQVFGRPAQSISEISACTGENVETLLAYGRISLITRDFSGSQYYLKRKNEIKQLRSRLGATPADDLEKQFELRKKIAETWYDMAQLCYQIVAYLEPHYGILQSQGKLVTAGGTGFNAVSYQDMCYYRIIYEYFVASLVQSRYYYNSMLHPSLMAYKGGKIQLQLIQKLIDIYRIIAIIPTRGGGMKEYRSFLSRISELSEGRHPYLYRFAVFERSLLDQPDEWMKRYPNLKGISDIVAKRVPAILDFIKSSTVSMVTR